MPPGPQGACPGSRCPGGREGLGVLSGTPASAPSSAALPFLTLGARGGVRVSSQLSRGASDAEPVLPTSPMKHLPKQSHLSLIKLLHPTTRT